jgi:DNA-binding CsgD family transcriptional regulator
VSWRIWLVEAFLLEALARDALGDEDAAERALEHALDQAEPDGALLPFLLHPVPDLLARHAPHRTSHAALIVNIQNLMVGNSSGPPSTRPLPEPLSESELRVLRYLPTNLTAPEIAGELSVSRNTVKTHMRNLYTKLGSHRRAEAVARARNLGLLAPITAPTVRGPTSIEPSEGGRGQNRHRAGHDAAGRVVETNLRIYGSSAQGWSETIALRRRRQSAAVMVCNASSRGKVHAGDVETDQARYSRSPDEGLMARAWALRSCSQICCGGDGISRAHGAGAVDLIHVQLRPGTQRREGRLQ